MTQNTSDLPKASLVVVGSGIKFVSHLTTEARVHIEQAEKVLFLVNDPAMQIWIQRQNKNAESLDPIYTQYPLRLDCYRAITAYILETVRKEQHVCVVLYGHPTVFAQPALNAVIQAKKEGYFARVLPGICASDCLFADLLIDPSSSGCQFYETTDFLIYRRPFNPTSHLLLWQVGFIGSLDHTQNYDNQRGAQLLVDYLSTAYPLDHEVVLYEAAQYPHLEPHIEKHLLKQLPNASFSSLMTLYVPPAYKATYDPKILEYLKQK